MIVLPLPSFEETPCKWEADSKGIEATLHQIALGLQNVAEGYLSPASHISKIAPYELPQVIAQIPPSPMNVHIPVRKALMMEGENKVVNYLLHGKYELNKTSWSKLQKNMMLAEIRFILLSKEKEDPEAPKIGKRRNRRLNRKPQLQ